MAGTAARGTRRARKSLVRQSASVCDDAGRWTGGAGCWAHAATRPAGSLTAAPAQKRMIAVSVPLRNFRRPAGLPAVHRFSGPNVTPLRNPGTGGRLSTPAESRSIPPVAPTGCSYYSGDLGRRGRYVGQRQVPQVPREVELGMRTVSAAVRKRVGACVAAQRRSQRDDWLFTVPDSGPAHTRPGATRCGSRRFASIFRTSPARPLHTG